MHTPGPWEVTVHKTFFSNRGYVPWIMIEQTDAGQDDREWIVEFEKRTEQDTINAQHIVDCVNACEVICNPVKTVPKLLEACKAIDTCVPSSVSFHTARKMARQALAEAEGRE